MMTNQLADYRSLADHQQLRPQWTPAPASRTSRTTVHNNLVPPLLLAPNRRCFLGSLQISRILPNRQKAAQQQADQLRSTAQLTETLRNRPELHSLPDRRFARLRKPVHPTQRNQQWIQMPWTDDPGSSHLPVTHSMLMADSPWLDVLPQLMTSDNFH